MRNHLPENTRFVYASFGGENSGHAGSKAFVDRHIARDKNFTKANVVCLDEIRSGSLLLAKSDLLRKAKYVTIAEYCLERQFLIQCQTHRQCHLS